MSEEKLEDFLGLPIDAINDLIAIGRGNGLSDDAICQRLFELRTFNGRMAGKNTLLNILKRKGAVSNERRERTG